MKLYWSQQDVAYSTFLRSTVTWCISFHLCTHLFSSLNQFIGDKWKSNYVRVDTVDSCQAPSLGSAWCFMSFKFIYGPDQEGTVFLQEEEVSKFLLTCNLLFSETRFNFSYGLGRIPWENYVFLSFFDSWEYIRYKFIPESNLRKVIIFTSQKLNDSTLNADLEV